jgi:hypothetical protein
MRTILAALLFVPIVALEATGQAPADSGRRSPIAAGIMSFIMPGVGSAYAGNNYHGAIHGSIALTLAVGGAVAASADHCNGQDCPGQNQAAIVVIIAAYLTNEVWSVFTAAKDARAYNRWFEQPKKVARIESHPALPCSEESAAAPRLSPLAVHRWAGARCP